MSLVQGQTGGTWDYYPTLGGSSYDPVSNGGSMTSATVYAADNVTVLLSSTSVARVSPGFYRFTFTGVAPAAGQYPITTVWVPSTGGQTVTDTNDKIVCNAFGGGGSYAALTTLDEVKSYLNITGVDAARDTELSSFISAATAMIEDRCGPIIPRVVTETHRGAGPYIALRNAPVLTVTGITEIYGPGATRTVTIYDPEESGPGFYSAFLETTTGMLRRTDSTTWGAQIRVTYTAGYNTVPEQARLACLELVRHLYAPQRGPRQAGVFPTMDPPMQQGLNPGFAMPYRVLEILGTLIRTPGLA